MKLENFLAPLRGLYSLVGLHTPAVTYQGSTSVRGKSYNTVAVNGNERVAGRTSLAAIKTIDVSVNKEMAPPGRGGAMRISPSRRFQRCGICRGCRFLPPRRSGRRLCPNATARSCPSFSFQLSAEPGPGRYRRPERFDAVPLLQI